MQCTPTLSYDLNTQSRAEIRAKHCGKGSLEGKEVIDCWKIIDTGILKCKQKDCIMQYVR